MSIFGEVLTKNEIEWFHDGYVCNVVLIPKRGRPPMTEEFWYDPDRVNPCNDVIIIGATKGAWLGEFEEDI